MSIIKFYHVNKPYGYFSNFSPHPIFIENMDWATVEHYFQASKFDDIILRKKIQQLDSPMKAAIEGRNKSHSLRLDWEFIKEEIMKKALSAKFLQHPNLRVELLKTLDSVLIEDTINDNYWGNGGNGSGKNRLGILLMEVRREMRIVSDDMNIVLPPWISFSNVGQHDMLWRMGIGEDYLTQWAKYFLSCNDKVGYKNMFAPPQDWSDIYE
jgi:N-glycosidase YbiA